MKIAIHHREGSYSPEWIEYCKKNSIDYEIVNCYDTNIIQQLDGFDILLFNWEYWHSRDILFAKQLIYSVEEMGITVYPNTRSSQFFDDKLGQKYFLEALKAPLIPSYAFFYKQEALSWAEKTTFPKVFKLRGGASSQNVKLVYNKRQAKKYIRKAFSRGFPVNNRMASLKDKRQELFQNKSLRSFISYLKGFYRVIVPNMHDRVRPRERSYIYFQDFVDNCTFDIRVMVVGEKAVAGKRLVRKGDFRASGGPDKFELPELIPHECVKLAFELNDKLKMQCVNFDFLLSDGNVLLTEISYNIGHGDGWPGIWNRKAEFTPGFRTTGELILEDIINDYQRKNVISNSKAVVTQL